MQRWQFDLVFVVFLLGAVFLLFAKTLGVEIDSTALTGYGAITTYVLTQRGAWTKNDRKNGDKKPENDE